jgi:hypothetical protein
MAGKANEHFSLLHRSAHLRLGDFHHHHPGRCSGHAQAARRAVPGHHAAADYGGRDIPGADAQVVANNVAAPIEQQVNGADNMIYMNSSSSATGNMTLNVFFEIGTDPSLAQVDVQNRVNLALPQLPSAVQSQGIQVQKNPRHS